MKILSTLKDRAFFAQKVMGGWGLANLFFKLFITSFAKIGLQPPWVC